MTRSERSVLIGTVGLAVTVLGVLLPWARIGGRSRSGLRTADTFIALAKPLPDAVAWVGRWWYLPAFLAVVAWATTFARSHIAVRAGALISLVAGAAMWWLFVWAGSNYNVLSTQLIGPVVATLGLVIVGFACSQPRDSLLRPTSSTPPPNGTAGQVERPI